MRRGDEALLIKIFRNAVRCWEPRCCVVRNGNTEGEKSQQCYRNLEVDHSQNTSLQVKKLLFDGLESLNLLARAPCRQKSWTSSCLSQIVDW